MKGALAALALLTGIAHAQTSEEEVRYRALIAEVRCLVCQNQSIAESNAPLAEDLRGQIRAQIAAGKSDREILEFLTERYGDFVRYRPAFKGQTLLIWVGPFVLLALAAGSAVAFIRRSRASAAAPRPDARRLAQLLDDEDGGA